MTRMRSLQVIDDATLEGVIGGVNVTRPPGDWLVTAAIGAPRLNTTSSGEVSRFVGIFGTPPGLGGAGTGAGDGTGGGLGDGTGGGGGLGDGTGGGGDDGGLGDDAGLPPPEELGCTMMPTGGGDALGPEGEIGPMDPMDPTGGACPCGDMGMGMDPAMGGQGGMGMDPSLGDAMYDPAMMGGNYGW